MTPQFNQNRLPIPQDLVEKTDHYCRGRMTKLPDFLTMAGQVLAKKIPGILKTRFKRIKKTISNTIDLLRNPILTFAALHNI